MDLKTLNAMPSIQKRKRRKRVGRGPGSGIGKTCGRGHKGAGSRSGYRKLDYYEGGNIPMIRRFPKRGFSNAMFKTRYAIVHLGDLNRFEDGAAITQETLQLKGLVSNPLDGIKLLSDGELTRSGLTVTVHRASAKARAKLEAAGGTLTELIPRKKHKPTAREFALRAKAKAAEAAAKGGKAKGGKTKGGKKTKGEKPGKPKGKKG